MSRILALAASIGCTVLAAADCLKSLAGNGRPDSLDAHFASVPRDEPTACTCDGAWTPAELIEAAPDLAVLDAVNTYEDFLYLCGGDA